MDEYRVSVRDGMTIIEQPGHSFKMSIQRDCKRASQQPTALLEATLYKEDGVFVPEARYRFEALGSDGEPLVNCANVEHFTAAVDFFFSSVLNTEYYVKNIPRSSTLCTPEKRAFAFD